ncbi:hypothetical protein [Geobacillus phage TP-84]|uniref:Uncharacterized protein n=1 Tax=Geobacillus phage TP-84 TaxID=1965361 RepID=A0A1U9WQL4_9CAUD|nr:hypothetical protein MUK65_gp56 [Geobacillus phage TP-84]AQY55074.1 hypothetical protein [Geobacillus phage TP-84]
MEKKQKFNPILSFQTDESVCEFIQKVMIKRMEFNRSNIVREIFMIGLEEFKKRHPEIDKK